jgi:ATP-dependent 26S proteasome regulatory subunit
MVIILLLFWVAQFDFWIQVVEVPNVSWEDIGGLKNVKRELQEVIRCSSCSCSNVAEIFGNVRC